MNQPNLSVPIIGYHRSPLSQKFGIPRQPNLVALPSVIELIAPYNSPEAFEGVETFSHLWVSWQTHHNQSQSHFKPKVRPPRLGGNDRLGVFATRSTYRPSQLGLSVVKLIKVEVVDEAVKLHISGADMVDGTPIIDIKPYIAYSDAIPEAVSGFATEKPDLKPVIIKETAKRQLTEMIDQPRNSLTSEDIDMICQLIAQDPRPAYRQKQSDRVFYMRYKNFDVGFTSQSIEENSGDNTLQSSPSATLVIVSIDEVNLNLERQ